jgi:CelD/BcsL family acetyltransferase involved in cellulose biosynthesis/ribosomal protein S18 acetylase RimI-like enzyme
MQCSQATGARRSCAPEAAGPAASALRVEAIVTRAALARLRPQWERLWAQDPRATPFQSPHWLLPWWRHVGRGRLASLALRSAASGELVGLAPLYVHVDRATRRRHLFPVGIATSDYLDLLAGPGWADRVADAVLATLGQCGNEWDVIEVPQLRPGAPLLRAAAATGWRHEITAGETNPVLQLAAPLPTAMAASLRTARNRAARAGGVAYERAEARTLPAFLDALVRLHTQRWAGRGGPGVLRDAAVLAAHAEAVPLLHAAGMLRLHGLRVAGELVAVLYCLADPAPAHARRCYYYLGGFDPRFAALSPGTLLVAHAIEQARAEGATAFDFLRGAESYKYRWGAEDQVMASLRLWREGQSPREATGQGGRPVDGGRDAFSVRLGVVIRPCRADDLAALEWFGLFTPQRPLIRRVYEEHRRGAAMMLVAEVNGETSGQLWIAFHPAQGVGEIWALRVLPCLQRKGIGTRMLAAAEALLRERGFARVELAVEVDNAGAHRLYERLGYRPADSRRGPEPPDLSGRPAGTQRVLAKQLHPPRLEGAR